MSRYQSRSEIEDVEGRSAFSKCLRFTWKTVTCIFSHVALITTVVGYCMAGAFTFEALEVEHEKEVKRSIHGIRQNVSDHLWEIASETKVLDQQNFTRDVSILFQNFESALVKAMTKDGWDGEEDTNIVQWTRTGSLFYSIIVITTIGYGHICPKTTFGKVVTIFYAILGIPLMLLCMSNIGDIMATSFRFLYWKVCCYVCTRPRRPRRPRSMRSSARSVERFSRSRNASMRRSMRTSTKSTDSGFGYFDYHMSRSDTDLRYHDYGNRQSLNRNRSSQRSRHSEFSEGRKMALKYAERGGSLDRRKRNKREKSVAPEMEMLDKTPVLCNKYVLKKDELSETNIPGITVRQLEGNKRYSVKRGPVATRGSHLQLPTAPDSEDEEDHPKDLRKKRSPARMNPSPKMMTPLGYGYRSKYLDDPDSDDEYYYDGSYYDTEKQRPRPVPIGLCVFLVMSYIIGGAFLFDYWEGWGILNSAYFCFITLTTIGFGDLVPAKGVSQDSNETTATVTISIALCSLYLLFGISLLAMSFNLVQEEVITTVKSIAKTLGIIESEDEEMDEEFI